MSNNTVKKFSMKLVEERSPLAMHAIFAKSEYSRLNPFELFTYTFGTVPNSIQELGIIGTAFNDWLLDNYETDIKFNFYNKKCLRTNRDDHSLIFDEINYFLYEDLIVSINFYGDGRVLLLFNSTPEDKVLAIQQRIKEFARKKEEKKGPKIFILMGNGSRIELSSMPIQKPNVLMASNYNEDFNKLHRLIVKRLNTKNDKGVLLLHGEPGTGKTYYIRHLISNTVKKVIFIPPKMADVLTNPNFISILIDNPNSILVIEDAEDIILDRIQTKHSPVSTLLNISDGLLADFLNIQIICSFNTDISRIDKALLRKGRLIAKYEFKKLEAHKAQALSDKLGFTTTITEPMTLTDIYNQEEKNFQAEKMVNSIGF